MGSFVYAMAGDRWAAQKEASRFVKDDANLKKYDSRILIQVPQPKVTYFLFCTMVLICTGWRLTTLYKIEKKTYWY